MLQYSFLAQWQDATMMLKDVPKAIQVQSKSIPTLSALSSEILLKLVEMQVISDVCK